MSAVLARTPREQGLSLDDLITALIEARDKFGAEAQVIFEAESTKASWTIASISADEDWIRLNGEK
jgi:hypothetical protein